MITWTYDSTPYLSSGDQIYEEMVNAYQAGAKVISIFNYPEIKNNPYGILQDEHFQAIEQFWNNYFQKQPESWGSIEGKVALVLPKDYGWGMRSPTDRIWYWNSDDKTPQIWDNLQYLLIEYGLELDIIYDDPTFTLDNKYQNLCYWNMTL